MRKSEVVILLSIYNGAKFLDKQLESLFKQKTNCNITIYYRDDGSTDESINIINLWKDRLSMKECTSSRKCKFLGITYYSARSGFLCFL